MAIRLFARTAMAVAVDFYSGAEPNKKTAPLPKLAGSRIMLYGGGIFWAGRLNQLRCQDASLGGATVVPSTHSPSKRK